MVFPVPKGIAFKQVLFGAQSIQDLKELRQMMLDWDKPTIVYYHRKRGSGGTYL